VTLPAGYTSRPATLDDLDVIAALIQAADLADLGFSDPMRDQLRYEWSTVGFDIGNDTRLAIEPNGRLAAYAEVVAHDPTRQISSWACVAPDRRGLGLGSLLADWIEAHAHGKLPAGSVRVPLRNSPSATDVAAHDLLGGRGFAHIRSFRLMQKMLLSNEPVEPPIDGVSIRRSSRGPDDRILFQILDEAFREHFGYEPYSFEDWSTQWFGDPNYDADLVFVAFDGEEPVGLSMALVEEGIGFIGELGIRTPWRRRGIGRGLLRLGFVELARRGVREVRLIVDAENASGATRLYEEVGMSIRREWHVYEKLIASD
jgi:mycothiol synthase